MESILLEWTFIEILLRYLPISSFFWWIVGLNVIYSRVYQSCICCFFSGDASQDWGIDWAYCLPSDVYASWSIECLRCRHSTLSFEWGGCNSCTNFIIFQGLGSAWFLFVPCLWAWGFRTWQNCENPNVVEGVFICEMSVYTHCCISALIGALSLNIDSMTLLDSLTV